MMINGVFDEFWKITHLSIKRQVMYPELHLQFRNQ